VAWHGVKSLLQKAERSAVGTPAQSPLAIVNALIELGDVCPSKEALTLHFMFLIIVIGRHRQQGHTGRTCD
jgi:hypothetical protein